MVQNCRIDEAGVGDEEMFRNIVEISPNIIFRTDRQGFFTYVSPAVEDILGYSADELVDTSFEVYLHDGDVLKATDAFGTVLDGEKVRGLEVRFRRKDGSYAQIEVNAVPVVEDDEIVEVQGITRDITGKKERERELEIYERMLNTVPDIVYALDEDGDLVAGNDLAAEMTGHDEVESISQVLDDEDMQRGRELVQELLESEDSDRGMLEMDLITADGERIPCENHIALLYEDGEFEGTVGVLRNIADRKVRESELERQNERLEEFASMVSHDLRSPLTVAKGRIELAQETGDGEHLKEVEAALDRMSSLIEQVLALARKGQTVGETEETEIEMLVEDAWESVETGDASLETDDLGTVEADEVRLREVFENLFRNSVEHACSDVTVRVGNLDDGFYVEDDGKGISEDKREQVFDYGYTTGDDGTGFGLSIVRNIVEAHGWEIELKESEEGGVRFEVTGV
ncbi:MAG: PAS domain S-box protein [Halobacteriales archaeon]|nr:PAS domain S-box protein [Halobacteriales archaeon]